MTTSSRTANLSSDLYHPVVQIAQGNQHGKPAGRGPVAAPVRKPAVSALAVAAFVIALVQLDLCVLPIDLEDDMRRTEPSLGVLVTLAASHHVPANIDAFTGAGIPLVALPVAAIVCGSIALARIPARRQAGRALAGIGLAIGILEALAGILLIGLILHSHFTVSY